MCRLRCAVHEASDNAEPLQNTTTRVNTVSSDSVHPKRSVFFDLRVVMPPKRPPHPAGGRGARKATSTFAKPRVPSLQELYLRSCAEMGLRPNSAVLSLLPDKGGADFTSATFDLSRNYVGDRGVAPILATLQRMPNVRAVVLSENGLRNKGVELLCTSAAQMSHLEFIDVSDNFISDGAAVALERLLRENRHIKDVAFENTKIPVEWRVKLLSALEANRNVMPPSALVQSN